MLAHQQRVPLTLPAELQWHLLPPLTFINPRLDISGVLAPAAEVAGDSFDYAINGDAAHVAIVAELDAGTGVALGDLRSPSSVVDSVDDGAVGAEVPTGLLSEPRQDIPGRVVGRR